MGVAFCSSRWRWRFRQWVGVGVLDADSCVPLMGTGVAQYIKIKEEEKRAVIRGVPAQHFQPAMQPPPHVNSFPRKNTGELVQPPSVTEGTTRHLGAEAPTRHLDASTEPPK